MTRETTTEEAAAPNPVRKQQVGRLAWRPSGPDWRNA
jgi:hypothetical protein